MARHEQAGERRELAIKPMGADADLVSFRIQRIEHRLLWAFAGFALWLAIVRYAVQPSVWLLAALAMVLAWWSHHTPPRRASQRRSPRTRPEAAGRRRSWRRRAAKHD